MPYGKSTYRGTRRTGGFRRRVATGNTKVPVKKVVRKYNNKLFKARVQRAMRGTVETKQKVWNLYNNEPIPGSGLVKGAESVSRGLYHANLLGNTNIGGCNLLRGLTQDTFVGNRIENVKLRLRGFVKSLDYDSTTNDSDFPFEVTILVYKNKNSPAADPNSLKSYPNNTNDKINTLQATLYPWNRDEYVIKKVHTVRLRAMPHEYSNGNTFLNGTVASGVAYRRFSLSVPIKKALIFPDLAVPPSNDWVGLGVYVTNGDGTSLGHAKRRAAVYMDGIITWTDA